MRWAGHAVYMGETRNVYRILVGKLEGNTPPGRPRSMWVENIQDVSYRNTMGWYRLYSSGSVMNLWVP
jgi:hypothetical protein